MFICLLGNSFVTLRNNQVRYCYSKESTTTRAEYNPEVMNKLQKEDVYLRQVKRKQNRGASIS